MQYIGKARMEISGAHLHARSEKTGPRWKTGHHKTPEFFGFLRFLVEESLYVEKWCWKQSQHQLCLQSDSHRDFVPVAVSASVVEFS